MLAIKYGDGVWPSAFQKLERPFYNWNNNRNKFAQEPKQDSWMFAQLIAISYVYWPIVMCATPVSCLADMVAGLVQAAFSADHARSILRKKMIASPIQHGVYLSVNLAPFILMGSMFGAQAALASFLQGQKRADYLKHFLTIGGLVAVVLGPMLALPNYHLAQRAVGKLPAWARPDNFNIFIGGGALDPTGQKLTDPEYVEQLYANYKKQQEPQQEPLGTSPPLTEWESFHQSTRRELSSISAPTSDSDFDVFSNLLRQVRDSKKQQLTEQELLGIEDAITSKTVRDAYHKWAPILHPDKNNGRRAEAEILFKALLHARLILSKKFRV